jgi:NifU-like protein involved in Fe-S cluster formation
MTATCREACCSVTPRFTVSELFERGFRRIRAEPLALQGETIRDAEGNTASFSLSLVTGRIAELRFRASACTTLIAYSEALAELLPGLDAGLAAHFTPAELVAAVPGVHPLKKTRAVLAVAALRAALLETESRHPDVAAKRPSKDDGVTLRGSATSSPHTSG